MPGRGDVRARLSEAQVGGPDGLPLVRVVGWSIVAFLAARAVWFGGWLLDRDALRTVATLVDGDLAQFLAWSADGAHYQMVAREGYGTPDAELRMSCDGLTDSVRAYFCPEYLGGRRLTNLPFFPLFPMIVRAGTWVQADPRWVGVAVAVAASVVAAGLIGVIGAKLYSPKVGIITAALWGAHPAGLVLWMGRPEALFTALSAGALLLLLSQRLVLGALVASVAGLARFHAVALVAATFVSAVRRRPPWSVRGLLAVLVAGLGVAVFPVWVAFRLHDVRGWLAAQESWGSRWDWGEARYDFVTTTLTEGQPLLVVSAWALVVSVVLLVAMIALRTPAELVVFTSVLLVMLLGQNAYHEHILRFLVVIFPLLLPLAVLLARLPRAVTALVIAAAAVAGGLLTVTSLAAHQYFL